MTDDDTAAREVIARTKADHDKHCVWDDDRAFADRAVAALSAAGYHLMRWRPISEAPKDGTIIWAQLATDLSEQAGRPDLERWDGVQVPLRHLGLAEDGFDVGWQVAAPVGHGGFPDNRIAGWMPPPPEAKP